MSELRFDPSTGQYVVYAPDRLKRPQAFKSPPPLPTDLENPFAVGSEDRIPGEVYAIREKGTLPDTPGWETRVFPNLYPAFEAKSVVTNEKHPLFESIAGVGGHEVVIETPDPLVTFEKLPVRNLTLFWGAVQNRMNHWKGVEGVRSVYLFKNSGGVAGASLPHSHSQLVALPVIPPKFADKNHFLKNQESYLDRLLETELKLKSRVVWESEHVVAFCPYVSRFPYEVIFYPRQPLFDFGVSSEEVLHSLSEAVRTVFAGIERSTKPNFPYNLFLNQIPVGEKGEGWFRWSLEVFPRVGGIAGFEMGTGMWMNSVLPEVAAKAIRGEG
jgi:UDPglucose--hexose-1-phosphate uridylyltransferase